MDSSEKKYLSAANLARMLGRSKRWVFGRLRLKDNQPGSIPHVRLTSTTGRKGPPLFDPDEIKEWMRLGSPSVEIFRRGADIFLENRHFEREEHDAEA